MADDHSSETPEGSMDASFPVGDPPSSEESVSEPSSPQVSQIQLKYKHMHTVLLLFKLYAYAHTLVVPDCCL